MQKNPGIRNHHPDLVALEVTWGDSLVGGHRQLRLSIAFGLRSVSMMAGTIRYGIREGELRLALQGGKVGLADRGLVAPLPRRVTEILTIESERTRGSEHQLATEVDGGSLALKGSAGSKESHQDRSKTQVQVQLERFLISTSGDDERPSWSIAAQVVRECLRGSLVDEHLCNVALGGGRCNVRLAFNVEPHHFLVHEVTGLFPDRLTANKRGILRVMFLDMIKGWHDKSLSDGEVVYERG